MSKWKCEICGNEFDNFHAQGFDNKIYCPLCFFKKENQQLKEALKIKNYCKYANKCNEIYDCSKEEYNDMCEANMKLAVDNDDLKIKLKQRDEVIDEAINYYESHKREVVIGRNKDEKLIKDYLLPSQCSIGLLKILQNYKGDNNE